MPTDSHSLVSLRRLAALGLAAGSALAASAAEPAAPASLQDALTQGKVSLNVRARSENVEQTGLKNAYALTLRSRLGYTTAAYEGFKASVEFENIVSPDGDQYSQAGINPGGTGRAVVADPEGSEVNQFWASYTTGKTTVTAGRQRLVLDNARFIGDVGWRQNMQTFDGLVLQDKSVDQLALTYAYLSRINRVFGGKHAQGRWDSNSHLVNASYSGCKAATVSAYAYLLDFRTSSRANSCATYGVSAAGGTPVTEDLKLTYRAEYAIQSDYGSSTFNYRADYYNLEAGLAAKPATLTLGYEVLDNDKGQGFKTPLATLHAFNGWADLFLTTPSYGLRDTYVKVTGNLPGGFSVVGFYHQFDADRGGFALGDEIDVSLTRKFGKQVTAMAKFAKFSRDVTTLPNVEKVWLQVEYSF